MSKKDIECPDCGKAGLIQTIEGGIVQKVWWTKDDIVEKEETTYDLSDEHDSYACAKCGKKLSKD